MRGFVFVLGIVIILFTIFGLPSLTGTSYGWWMGFLTGMVGGFMAASAVTA